MPRGYLTVFDAVDRLGAEVYSSWDKKWRQPIGQEYMLGHMIDKWRRDLAIPRINPGGKILDTKQTLDINLKTERVERTFQDALFNGEIDAFYIDPIDKELQPFEKGRWFLDEGIDALTWGTFLAFVRIADFEKFLAKRWKTIFRANSDKPKGTRQRGRKPQYKWPDFDAHCQELLDHNGAPSLDDPNWSNQAAVEEVMMKWCQTEWQREPSESVIRECPAPKLCAIS